MEFFLCFLSKALLAYGANVNASDKFGNTALIEATQCDRARIVEVFLIHNIFCAFYKLRILIHIIRLRLLETAVNSVPVSISQVLLRFGANVDATTKCNGTALKWAIFRSLPILEVTTVASLLLSA